jgi:chemosensory pili system protein ChpC
MGSEAVEELMVRCLQLPLRGLQLLVPNTTVAEVTGYLAPESMPQAPRWLLGTILWRGISAPLISYELLLGRESTLHSAHRRIAIINSLSANSLLPFIAVEIQGIPRLVQVKEDMLRVRDSDSDKKPMVASSVTLEGKHTIIPDLEVIEKMLLQLGIKMH